MRELSVCEGRQCCLRHIFLSRGANYQSMNVSNAALDRRFLSRGAYYQSVKVGNAALDIDFISRREFLVFEGRQRCHRHRFYLEARIFSLGRLATPPWTDIYILRREY